MGIFRNSLLLSIFLFQSFSGIYSATFTIINECSYTVWPGILSGAGTAPLSTTGFELPPGQSAAVDVPAGWSGRLWGRTLCSQDSATGKFTCLTGDCGSSSVECSGSGALPPATLAEFTLNGADGLDFYDVSLVDGYNLAMTVVPQVVDYGTGPATTASVPPNCTVTGCLIDLNPSCPSELKVVAREESVACRSACEAFGDPQYCCSGAYGTPDACKPSAYSEFFKSACPRAYSYAYDDGTSTFTCASANYAITFCPSTSPSVKSSSKNGEQRYPEAMEVAAGLRETTPSLVGFAAVVLAGIWGRQILF